MKNEEAWNKQEFLSSYDEAKGRNPRRRKNSIFHLSSLSSLATQTRHHSAEQGLVVRHSEKRGLQARALRPCRRFVQDGGRLPFNSAAKRQRIRRSIPLG